jgi:MltA-interacting protein MipA
MKILTLLFLAAHSIAFAQDKPEVSTTLTTNPPPKPETAELIYVVGARIRIADFANASGNTKLAPLIGFKYGRWKVGTNADIDEWLIFNGFRKEPTLSYDFFQSDRFQSAFSLRIQNLTTGEAFDFSEPGKKTLRGRALLNYKLTNRTYLGFELTRDLLDRGDGTTVSTGVSRMFPVSEKSIVVANAGVVWADREHWRTSNSTYAGSGALGAGFGLLGIGVSYRYSPSKNWAWYATTGLSRPIGQIANFREASWQVGGQIGLMYFGKL